MVAVEAEVEVMVRGEDAAAAAFSSIAAAAAAAVEEDIDTCRVGRGNYTREAQDKISTKHVYDLVRLLLTVQLTFERL